MGHYQCKCFKNTKSGSLPKCSCASRYCPDTAHTAEAGVSREKLRATLSSHTPKTITPAVASSHHHQKGGGGGGVEKWRQGRGEGTRKIKWQITRLINTCNCLPKCKAYENSKINKCNTGITSMSWSQGRRGWGGLQSIGLTWEAAASSAAMCGGEVGWGWGCICVCCLC